MIKFGSTVYCTFKKPLKYSKLRTDKRFKHFQMIKRATGSFLNKFDKTEYVILEADAVLLV